MCTKPVGHTGGPRDWIRRSATAAGLVAVLLVGRPALAQESRPDDGLRVAIGRLVAGARLGQTRWAMRVLALPSRSVLHEYAPQEGLIPASNMKLATTAAAVEVLGGDFRFETILGRRGRDLVIMGSGDPAIGDPVLAERDGHKPEEVFLRWALVLKDRGISRIEGDLVVDDSIFDRRMIHPNWPADQQLRWYEAPVAGLNYHNNCVDVWVWPTRRGEPAGYRIRPATGYVEIVNECVTGGRKRVQLVLGRQAGTNRIRLGGRCPVALKKPESITIADPPLFFATVLREVLAGEGIAIEGATRLGRVRGPAGEVPPDVEVLASAATPLRRVLWRCNTRSLNMAAECLLKTLGAHSGPVSSTGERQGNWASGAKVVQGFLEKVGVPPHSFVVDDGSGMSRRNVFTVYGFTQVLAYMFDHPQGELFRDSLAVAGETGTLRRRLTSRKIRGKVLGKTGTLRGVSSLSGYVRTEGGEWLCFSMIFNDVTGKVRGRCLRLQSQVCELLVGGEKGTAENAESAKD